MTSEPQPPEHHYVYVGQSGNPAIGVTFDYLERFTFPPGQGPSDGLGPNVQHGEWVWDGDGWIATKKMLATWL